MRPSKVATVDSRKPKPETLNAKHCTPSTLYPGNSGLIVSKGHAGLLGLGLGFGIDSITGNIWFWTCEGCPQA